MNISEAVRTQTLLAWLTDPTCPRRVPGTVADPDAPDDPAGPAVSAARFLADRARRALGAGPDADHVEAALRDHLARTDHTDTDREVPGRADRLVRLAELLQPCPRPDYRDGSDLCAHAEPWPCTLTQAAWLAADAGQDAGL